VLSHPSEVDKSTRPTTAPPQDQLDNDGIATPQAEDVVTPPTDFPSSAENSNDSPANVKIETVEFCDNTPQEEVVPFLAMPDEVRSHSSPAPFANSNDSISFQTEQY